MSDRNRRPQSGRQPGRPSRGREPGHKEPSASATPEASGARPSAGAENRPPSGGPSGQPRAGRRENDRRRPPQPATPTLIDKLRKPFLASFVVFVLTAVALVAFTQGASSAYGCTAVDTVQSPEPGELGQVQHDQGSQHVQNGDKVQYDVCPPASGKHNNQPGYGPIEAKVYGPNDRALPSGWIHNLEHGGLVVLYSCAKGAPCDSTATAPLQAFYAQLPASPVCKLPPGPAPGAVSPVIARFDQMPTKYAALVWDHALYLDTLDTAKIDQFFLRYAERRSADGSLIAPPEPQCAAPSSSPAGSLVPQGTSPSPAPSASGS